MKEKFILSIVIPTKNRAKYALATVEQILKIKDERIQIVIQDNSDTPILAEMLFEYSANKRLKYNYTPGIMSFVKNFDIAVNQADGEFICIIGDDDGIVPQIIDVVLWAKKNHIDAIKPSLNAVYFWPNSEAIKNKIDDGYLSISKISLNSAICNPSLEVEKLLKRGAQDYLTLDMVKLYHGIVKRSCLDQVKKQTEKYFGGLSPDIYISVALSLTVKKMVKVEFPLTISGICNKSGSSDSATGKHTGNLRDAPHFKGHENYEWSELVPKFYSVDTIWADSALAAIKDLNRKDLIAKFNFEFLFFNCIIKYPKYKNFIIQSYLNIRRKNLIITLKKSVSYFIYKIIKLSKGFARKIRYQKNDSYRINGIDNISKASQILQKRFLEIGLNKNIIIKSLDKVLEK